jgi:hypothetical protein
MADSEQKTDGPIIVDTGTFSPVPENTFVYPAGGRHYNAFSIMKVKRATRNRFFNFYAHIKKLSLDDIADFTAELIGEFVVDAPVEALREEPVDFLIDSLMRLAGADGAADGAKHPTKVRGKSSSRTRTPRSRASTA